MFKRLAEKGPAISITVDGRKLSARAGDTVAAALAPGKPSKGWGATTPVRS